MLNLLSIGVPILCLYDKVHDIILCLSFLHIWSKYWRKAPTQVNQGMKINLRLSTKMAIFTFQMVMQRHLICGWTRRIFLVCSQNFITTFMPGQTPHAAYLPSQSGHACFCCTIFSYAVSGHVPFSTTAECNGQSTAALSATTWTGKSELARELLKSLFALFSPRNWHRMQYIKFYHKMWRVPSF